MTLYSSNAYTHSYIDALSYLITSGSPVNDPAGESNATALHYAVAGGHEGCVKILVENGASVNAIATNEEVYSCTIVNSL